MFSSIEFNDQEPAAPIASPEFEYYEDEPGSGNRPVLGAAHVMYDPDLEVTITDPNANDQEPAAPIASPDVEHFDYM